MAYNLHLVTLVFLSAIITGCQDSSLYLTSPAEDQSFTVSYSDDKFYLQTDIDEASDLQFDLKGVPLDSRALFICWSTEKTQMEVLCPDSKIIDSAPEAVIALTAYKRNEAGLPDIAYYHKEGCFELGFDPVAVFPKEHALISDKN